MAYGIRKSRGKYSKKKVKARKTLVIGALCLCLFVCGPHYQSMDVLPVGLKPVWAQTSDGNDQDSGSSGSDDDTPSAEDQADFTSEHDRDGDGEFDEPEEEADDVADEAEPDEADEADEADQDDGDDDESDDQDRENQFDDDDDGEETDDDDDEDIAHSGKNRDDIDGEASPEFRLSGYDRYRTESKIRRLGAREELKPLIAREERMLLEN